MYRVEVNKNPDATFQVKSKDYEFTVSNKGKGINPLDTFLSSLGTCVGVYVNKYLEGAKMGDSAFSVLVEAELTKEAPYKLQDIRVNIKLDNSPIDQRRKDAILEFVKNCPVHNTLKSAPFVDIKII